MTEYCYTKYDNYLDNETLLFWMKFYYSRISEIIPLGNGTEFPTEEDVERGNRSFINFSNKITHIMNDILYGFYMSTFKDFSQEYNEDASETNIPGDGEEEYIEEEYDGLDEPWSDDPMDYLPENATIADVLSMHFQCDGQFYTSTALLDIFKKFNISFMGLTGNNNTLKIYANSFIFKIYTFPDAIDVSIEPSDKEWSKAAIMDYFNLFKDNKLKNNNGNMRTYDSCIKRFYTYLKNSECILSNYYYDETEHLHALFSLAMDGIIEVKSVKNGCIQIDAENFVNGYENDNLQTLPNTKLENNEKDNDELNRINQLKELDIEIISARAYLEEMTPDRIRQKDIAEFIKTNGIFGINTNYVKQRIHWIYNILQLQDLGVAVVLLKKYNRLITYENVVLPKFQ